MDSTSDPRSVRARLVGPVVAIAVVAPFFGEGLSGSTSPLDLILPWNLAFMAALYGSGALLCREIAHRRGLGLGGLMLLGAAYGVYEEGVVDRYWFYPTFWRDSGVGDYSVVWHTNVLLAVHLTVFHAAVSVTASVLVVERIFPARRATPWVGPRGLVVAAIALAAVPFLYGELGRDPAANVAAAAVLAAALVVATVLWWPRRSPAPSDTAPPTAPAQPGRRGLGLIAGVAAAAHFVLVYALPSSGLPWPITVAASLVPVVAGAMLIRRLGSGGPYGPDARRAVAGLLGFFALLDVFVALSGGVDRAVGAVLVVGLLWWLRRREVHADGAGTDVRPTAVTTSSVDRRSSRG